MYGGIVRILMEPNELFAIAKSGALGMSAEADLQVPFPRPRVVWRGLPMESRQWMRSPG